MPTYSFECKECGHKFDELVQRFGQDAPCPECGSGNVERQVSAPSTRTGDRLRNMLDGRGGGCSSPPGMGFG